MGQVKTFELGLDHRRTMERVQLQFIPQSGLTLEEWHEQIRSYLAMWWTFLKIHKHQQFTIEDRTPWPDHLPWPLNDSEHLPLVT